MMRSMVLVGAVRVQRAEAQVSGLREGNRMFHRLGIANFADQNHVRRLTQRILERVMPGVRIDAHLTMRDQGLLGFMHELDRDPPP